MVTFDTALGRPVRHLAAERTQDDPPAPAPGCARPLLAGFLVTIAIGMCIPHVAYVVLGGH